MFEKFEKLVNLALAEGFEKAEVYASAVDSFSVGVYEGHIENYSVAKRAGLSLRGLLNGQMGYASTESDDESEYAELVARAKENAEVLESQDEQFLYDGTEKLDWISSLNPELEKVTPEQKIALAMDLEKKCLELGGEGTRVASCEVGTDSSSCVMVNSLGLHRTFESNTAYAAVEVVIAQGDEQYPGFAFRFTRDFNELNVEELVKEALAEARKYIGCLLYTSDAADEL